MQTGTRIVTILEEFHADILNEWIRVQLSAAGRRTDLIREPELREQCGMFVKVVVAAARAGNLSDIQRPEWGPARDLLRDLSRSRAKQGFSPGETATFVLSFKQPLFSRIRSEIKNADELGDTLWAVTEMIDKLGLYTTDIYQRSREEIIARQQTEMLELSTPVVQLWDGVLALPLIGTLDSARTQTVMETLLQRVVDTGSEVAIIDITGVPTVDTLTAQHLLKTITATRLMGAECIISGIRPQIAQTIVHLGVDLAGVVTKSSMAAALALALERRGFDLVSRRRPPAPDME